MMTTRHTPPRPQPPPLSAAVVPARAHNTYSPTSAAAAVRRAPCVADAAAAA